MENMSVADIAAVTNRGYGYNDGFGMNGGWFWIVLLLFFGRGFYGNNDNLQTDVDTRFIERDIFNTNQNVSNTACQTQRDVIEGKYDTELSIANLASQTQNCCCETQKEILQSRYDNALAMQGLQAQLSNCCCDLKTAIHAEGEATRGLIQENTIQDLRDRLAASQRETDTANLALQNNAQTNTILTTLGRYVTNPYVPYNYGCGCVNTCNY